jgi:hypothetical protein
VSLRIRTMVPTTGDAMVGDTGLEPVTSCMSSTEACA